ncbi:MAG TPA: CPBP family intramembrane glutamic endopeptidase [Candidatus Dormibacteraeota bacterium]
MIAWAGAPGRALRLGHPATMRAVLLVGGGAAAAGLRAAMGGAVPAASLGAATVFALVLLVLSVAAGFRVRRTPAWVRAVSLGAGGALLLVALWLSSVPHVPVDAARHLGTLLLWTPVVALVATGEEVMLRGALFTTLEEGAGPASALAVTSVAFALLHVPLYGWAALPLDLAAGVLLGGLRLLTGGVTAPAVAHVAADLAAGWLG